MAAPSWQDFYDVGQAEIVGSPLSLRPGDISDMMLSAAAAVGDRLTGYALDRFKATFLDGAEDEDLTTLTDDHWSITKREASAATGEVTFTRATDDAGAGTIDAGSIVATEKDANGQDIRFTTDVDTVFGATDLTKTVAVTCSVGGRSTNAGAGLVNKVITNLFDSTITVSNASAMAGGLNTESDEDLRNRVRDFPSTLRRGTMAALEYGARTVSGVANATAIEGVTGLVTVYVSDADGNSSPTMVSDVNAEMPNWRAAGALVTVLGGALYNSGHLAIDISLTVRLGVDIPTLVANIKESIANRVNRLKIGDICYRSLIRTAAMSVAPDDILEVTVNAPAANVAPAANEIIRTTTADISVT